MTRFDLPIVYGIASDGKSYPLAIQTDGSLQVRAFVGTPALNLLTNVTPASLPATGLGFNLLGAYSNFLIQMIIVSGTVATISWYLDGSNNGVNWYGLAVSTDISNGSILFSSGKPFVYLRSAINVLTGVTPVVSIIGCATP